MFLLLMRVRLQSAKNTLFDSLRRHPVWTALLSLLGVLMFAGVFWLFAGLFAFAQRIRALNEISYQVFYLLFLFLFAGAVPFIASTLLQSKDYTLLFHAPLPPRAIIAAKLIDATVTSSLQFMVLGVPAIGACAFALKVSLLGWTLLPVMVAQFALLPILFTSLGLLILLQLLGMRRIRSVIALLNVIMGLFVCVIVLVQAQHIPLHHDVFSGSMLSAPVMPKIPTSVIPRVMPSAWFVSLLRALVHPEATWRSALAYLALITGINGGLFLLCLKLGELNISAASVAEEEEGAGAFAGEASSFSRGWYRYFAMPIAGLIRKDLIYVQRDTVLLSQLLMPALLIVVPLVLVMTGGDTDMREGFLPLSFTMVGIILFMQTSILSLSSIGLEGQSFWQYLSSPNTGRRLLWAKFVMSTLVSGGISGLFILYTIVVGRMEWYFALILPLFVMICAGGLCGLGVGISATFPRFIYENPAQRVSVWALVLGFFGAVVYIGVTFVAMLGAWLYLQFWNPDKPYLIWLLAGILHLALTAYIVFTSLTLGAKRIEKYQWEA